MPHTIYLLAPSAARFGGGITEFSRQLTLALQAQDTDLRLFGKHDQASSWNGIALSGAGRLPTALRTPYYSMQVLTAALTERPDELICTHLNFGPLARTLKRMTGTPYTLVAHGVDVHPGLSRARLTALREADRLIAVSRWTREQLLSLGGIQPERIAILPNTYDDQRFVVSRHPASLRERYKIQASDKVILTVGRLDPGERYKGYDQVLKALPAIHQTYPEVRYVIVGKGKDRDRIEALANELGVQDAVTFTGFVPDNELPDHYRMADVFAMPSTGEGFGIVFLESMGCGTPVLGGNLEGSVDALDHGRLGALVDPGSTEAVANGISSLLKHEGPKWWFDRAALSKSVCETFGQERFRRRVREIIELKPCVG